MKKYWLTFSVLTLVHICAAQQRVGINTASPAALLDVKAADPAQPEATDGLLVPRVNSFPASNPGALQNGMMIYLLNAQGNNAPGLYCWNNGAGAWEQLGPAKEQQWMQFYYPSSSANPGSNIGMSSQQLTTALLSTRPGTGIRNVNDIAPLAAPLTGNISSARITITDAAVLPPAAVVYPCYAFAAVYRSDYSNRSILGIIRFAITAPAGAGGVGNNGSFHASGLFHTENGISTDGIYHADKLYVVQGQTLVETTGIGVTGNWLLGAELLYPVNSGGNAIAAVATAAGNLSIPLQTPYARTIAGYKNVFLNIGILQ